MAEPTKKSDLLQVFFAGTAIREDDKKKPYTVYRIAVGKDDIVEWYVEHRYSDFVRLDKELAREYPNHNLPIKIPPRKMLNSLKPGTVDERRIKLEKYLLQMVDALPESEVLVRFLSDNMILPGTERKGVTSEGVMSGYLKKRGRRAKQFKTRWFVLTGFSLDYYHSRSDAIPAGSFPLLAATVCKVESPFSKYAFNLVLPSSTHLLLAESEGERDSWVRKIGAHAEMLAPATWEGESVFEPYIPLNQPSEMEVLKRENEELKKKLATAEDSMKRYRGLLAKHNIDPEEGLSDEEIDSAAPIDGDTGSLDDLEDDDDLPPIVTNGSLSMTTLARAITAKRESIHVSSGGK